MHLSSVTQVQCSGPPDLTGEMAVSRNGSWECDGCGVVIRVDAMRKGVYPAFTASCATLRCRLSGFQHGLPPRKLWRRRRLAWRLRALLASRY